MINKNEIYLGDGVYASFEEEMQTIWLRTERRDRELRSVQHFIALEPLVVEALLSYIDALRDNEHPS